MRILYLIGNGFDLHVGLKTSYFDFLKYYLHQPFPADIDDVGKRFITRLKTDINQNFKLWSDLELQYGKHMARLGTMGSTKYSLQEELDIINDDLRDKLSVYIGGENKRAVFSGGDKGKFLTDIVKPEQHLRDFEQTEIQSRKNSIWNKTTNKSATNNMKAIFVHNLKPATPADVRNKIDDLFKVSSTCSVWLR